MLWKIRTGLRRGRQRDRELFRRHRALWLTAGLLWMALVGWACAASAGQLAPENAGRLASLRYGYGSFWGEQSFTLEREEDGQLYLTAIPFNGWTLNVRGPVGEETLEELAALLAREGIFAWDGFQGSDPDILDGFSFGLEAVFEGGTLTAGGYEAYPAGFEAGHAALSGYLTALAESIRPTSISAPSDIRSATLSFDADLSVTVAPAEGREPASASYRHGKTTDTHTGDALPPALLEAFFGRAMTHYNLSAASGNTGCAFALELSVVVNGVETTLSLPAETDPEKVTCEQTPLEDAALALVGRPEGLFTESFALEEFQNGLLYTELLLWDPEGLGEIRVNLPNLTATVDGRVWQLPLHAMRDFAALMGAADDPVFACLGDANRLTELEGAGKAHPRSARIWWQDDMPRPETGWRFGRVHSNGHFLYLYGGDTLPADWDEVRLTFKKLIAWGQPMVPSNSGALLSFSWRYYTDETAAFCNIQPAGDGHLYLRAGAGPGVPVTAYGRVEPEVLEDLAAVLTEQDLFAWNGFEEWADTPEALDGFRLEAVFARDTLRASGDGGFPQGFEEARQALEAALGALAEPYSSWAPAIEDIDLVELWREEAGYALAVRAPLDGEPAAVSLRVIGEEEDWRAIDDQTALDFLRAASDFYLDRAATGHTGGDFQLYIGTPWLPLNRFTSLLPRAVPAPTSEADGEMSALFSSLHQLLRDAGLDAGQCPPPTSETDGEMSALFSSLHQLLRAAGLDAGLFPPPSPL